MTIKKATAYSWIVAGVLNFMIPICVYFFTTNSTSVSVFTEVRSAFMLFVHLYLALKIWEEDKERTTLIAFVRMIYVMCQIIPAFAGVPGTELQKLLWLISVYEAVLIFVYAYADENGKEYFKRSWYLLPALSIIRLAITIYTVRDEIFTAAGSVNIMSYIIGVIATVLFAIYSRRKRDS